MFCIVRNPNNYSYLWNEMFDCNEVWLKNEDVALGILKEPISKNQN